MPYLRGKNLLEERVVDAEDDIAEHVEKTPVRVVREPRVRLQEAMAFRVFFFLFTLVTGPRRSLSLKLSDTRVYEPQTRARLGTTAYFCKRMWSARARRAWRRVDEKLSI